MPFFVQPNWKLFFIFVSGETEKKIPKVNMIIHQKAMDGFLSKREIR